MTESRHHRTTRETSRRRYLTAAASMGLTLAAGCSGSASNGSASWSATITELTEPDYVQDVVAEIGHDPWPVGDVLELTVEVEQPEGPIVECISVLEPDESERYWVDVDSEETVTYSDGSPSEGEYAIFVMSGDDSVFGTDVESVLEKVVVEVSKSVPEAVSS